jgi:3-hydroxy-9,10-secoandrosta-1,3,5(10)-triene-9,17-dione monooxygenase
MFERVNPPDTALGEMCAGPPGWHGLGSPPRRTGGAAVTATMPARTTPVPTAAEVVARAEAIAATLVARQAETEDRTYYSPETHAAFAEAGLYRILVPRRYGGLQLGPATYLRVAMALARGCPSTGWMFTLGAAHSHAVATLFDEPTQAALFADPDFIAPATIVPNGTAERAADGSWVVNGTYAYCSGAPYATHFIGHAMTETPDGPAPMLFIVPCSEFERLDDWGGQLGLKGSGSHSIVVRDGRVPAEFTRPGHMSEVEVSGGTPGRELHGPDYGGGLLGFMVLESAALAVGMAKGALDAYEELMRSRITLLDRVSRTEDPDYQMWYSRAAGMIATAEAAVLDGIRQWGEISARGAAAFTREEDLRIAIICREVLDLAWRAVETHLFPTAGSSAVRAGERIERVWRDMSTLRSHSGNAVLLATVATREYSRVHFGLA